MSMDQQGAGGSVVGPRPERDPSSAFFRWSVGIYLVVSAVLVGAGLRASEGHLVYVLDDPAIHLSVAQNLAEHGTWGVVPGEYQSASSSPLWTVLLAVGVWLLPAGEEALALVVNLVAGVMVLAILARAQSVLHPSLRRPLDLLATAFVAVVVLFLPAAAMVGMEHVLHVALVMAAAGLLLQRGPAVAGTRRSVPYVLLVVATLTRPETAFVAAGLGVATVLDALPWGRGGAQQPWRPVAGRVVGLGLASGLPLLAVGAANRAMGQEWLPNSVMAKSTSLNGEGALPRPRDILDRLALDPLLLLLVAACLILAIIGWRSRTRWAALATATAVAALLHAALAQVGWYERYQMYLIGLALLALAWAGRDLPAPVLAAHPHVVALLILVLSLTTATKMALTVEAPRAVADTYQQRYQAALFLERYYEGEPVATGELGYISLFHEGPVTDLYGLGDHEVLLARRAVTDTAGRAAYWDSLAQRRGASVAVVYPMTLGFEVPRDWILVGTWTLPRDSITAFDEDLQFWATRPEEVAPLAAHLTEFEQELPDGVGSTVHDLAALRAETMLAERERGHG